MISLLKREDVSVLPYACKHLSYIENEHHEGDELRDSISFLLKRTDVLSMPSSIMLASLQNLFPETKQET